MQVAEFNAPSSASRLTDLAPLGLSASSLKQPSFENLIVLHLVSSASITYLSLSLKGEISVSLGLIEPIELRDL